MIVLEENPAVQPKATLEDFFLFRERLEFLSEWRATYGGNSALLEAERLYAMRRAGDRRLRHYLLVPILSPTSWYWRRTGECQQCAYATVCPWCLPGPPGSKPYSDHRYMVVWESDLEWVSGPGPWDLECSECEREGTVS